MRYRARVDANQKEIVMALRALGCNVVSLAQLGRGVPDLLVQHRQELYLLEVKDGSKPPSARELTKAEKRFNLVWRSHVVRNIEEAFQAIDAYRYSGVTR